MPGNEIQVIPSEHASIDAWHSSSSGSEMDSGAPEKSGPSISRYVSALKRFKWLVLLTTVLGAVTGVAATKLLVPEYQVQATVFVEQGPPRGSQASGPIMATRLFGEDGYRDLLQSFAVVDAVVTDLALYLQPASLKDSVVFRNFGIDPSLRPGDYTLTVSSGNWVLSRAPGVDVERGVVGAPIGASVGFIWTPDVSVLAGRSEVRFRVRTPREASAGLIKRLQVNDKGNFLQLVLTDPQPQRAARIVNTWVEHFVSTAAALKKNTVALSAQTLDGQRSYAAEDLASAEAALLNFRVETVTQPTERQAIAPGVELTTNPAFDAYFRSKNLAESIQRDREAIQRALEEGRRNGTVAREAVMSIPSVSTDPAAQQVVAALKEQSDREAALRQLTSKYTDEWREVKIAREQLDTVRTQVVPRAIEAYLAQLSDRETRLREDVVGSAKELQGIPIRTIEEQRLKRKVEVADALYRTLDLEAARAKMAEAQATPDVRVHDPAVAPLTPTRNTAPALLSGAIAAGLGIGLALAILLDRLDKRFRYPEQATDELGLFILGVVPAFKQRRRGISLDTETQAVEAFRSIRMNVRYAADPTRPLTLAITSPGPNDGKSLIASNLALSFAESGARVLLIDGDLRRGELHKVFSADVRPGLVEYLDGTALIAEVLRPVASHANLTLMPGGVRRKRAPELLASPRFSQLIAQMSNEYDVIIVDCPPLGAGFDAFALATATGNVAVVLRAGITDRKMAASKLAVLQTLPVRVVGAVLNGIKLDGIYEYYSYYSDYAAYDEEPPMLPAPGNEKAPRAVSAGKS